MPAPRKPVTCQWCGHRRRKTSGNCSKCGRLQSRTHTLPPGAPLLPASKRSKYRHVGVAKGRVTSKGNRAAAPKGKPKKKPTVTTWPRMTNEPCAMCGATNVDGLFVGTGRGDVMPEVRRVARQTVIDILAQYGVALLGGRT